MIEVTWLGGEEGAFYRQSAKRRAQLVALWLEQHTPQSQNSQPKRKGDNVEFMDGADFVASMREHYSKPGARRG